MSAANKNSEKRRYTRRETRVEAVLAIGDKTSIQCVILDFCEQGLFLQLHQPSEVGLQKNKSAKIYFSAITDNGKEYFQIDAQIARVAHDGVGMVFENISESMYRALMQTTDMGSIAAYSKNPTFFLTSVNQDVFKVAFKELLKKQLPALMQEFFKIAEDELEKKPEFAENFHDVAAMLALTSVLRMNKDTLIADYCQHIIAKADFTGDKSTQNKDSDYQIGSGLSLVEKNEFEDWLNFSSVIRKINNQYKNQLYQLELKISYVVCFPRYLISNPIDPEHLCNTFRDKIGSIDDSVAAKKALYKAFQITLSSHLATLYHAFDQLLVEYDAPSETAQDIVWKKNYSSNSRPSIPSENFQAPHQFPSFDNDEYEYDENWSPAPAQPSRSTSRPSFNQPVSQTANKLFSLINQSLAATQSQTGHIAYDMEHDDESPEVNSESEYSADELLAALTKLQASNALRQLPSNASNLLKTELGETASETTSQTTKSISAPDQQKLDIYDQLFRALIDELMLTPSIKSYMEKIKLPLMALTIQDPNFLDSENHPARLLLNQLFALETAVNQNKTVKSTQIKPMLDQIVSRIEHGSITNPDIFAKANEELKEITLPLAKSKELNIRRVIEVYEGKQKLEKARRKVQNEIDKLLAGKHIPSVIQLLLDSGWQHLLVISELNEEEQVNRQSYFDAIEHLLAWYDLDPIPEEYAGTIQMGLDFIDSKLGSVCTNAFTHTSIMDELKATLLGTGIPRVRKNLERILITGKSTSSRSAAENIQDSWHLQIEQFKAGDWFTFSMENQIFEPLKLIWIGELPQIYVFVNRDGYKKQELTLNDFAELLQSGVVTQIENLDEPLMDRATTTMLQQMQEKLIHSVSHDPITNLPNRKRFINLLKESIIHTNGSKHVLCYLEIEDFRVITNVCGIVGGDQLLLQTAQLLSKTLGKDGLISRLGDKIFGFLLKNCSTDEGIENAKKIRELINKSNFIWNDKSYTISVSIGLVPIIDNTYNVDELLQKADTVNISAKRSGHNRIRVYEEDDAVLKEQTDIHEWAGRIDRIFAQNRLFARCQMIAPIDPEKNTHSHYEILLGVRDDEGKVIAPDKFIPAVERCQRMPEIDRWMIEHVFGWIIENRNSFDSFGGFAINLSGQSLNSEEFLAFLRERLAVGDIPCEKITFEITETVAAGSLVFTKRFIKEIKHFGCKFSLDDFGTGYSSYSYLKSLDVDYLKIDGSFIKDITNSQTDVVMVNSMNEIAHSLELETIAEYVENMDIHAVLKNIGIDYAQGWGIHKPMPITELNALLNDTKHQDKAEAPQEIIENLKQTLPIDTFSNEADYWDSL